MEGEPTTTAIQATTEWEAVVALVNPLEDGLGVHLPVKVSTLLNYREAVFAHVKLQECGLGVHLPVTVTTLLSCCIYYLLTCPDT